MLLTKPERIIFLIDIHEEMAENWGNGNMSRMSAIKAALTNFMRRKSNPGILKHQFSLATFRSSTEVRLVQPFTRSFESMEQAMKSLEPEISDKISSANGGSGGPVDLSAVLTRLGPLVGVGEEGGREDDEFLLQSRDDFGFVSGGGSVNDAKGVNNASSSSNCNRSSSSGSSGSSSSGGNSSSSSNGNNQPYSNHPDYLVRCILIYGRSREIPLVTASANSTTSVSASASASAAVSAAATEAETAAASAAASAPFIPLLHTPWCYLDVLYVHLRANDEGVCCQEAFDALCGLHFHASTWGSRPVARHGSPLVLETHATSIKLASHVALLLAHPAQREGQEGLESKLDISAATFGAIRHSIGREEAAADLVEGVEGGGEGDAPPV
jgi:hypothetical protein